MNVNLATATPTEIYLINFLEKLNTDTLGDKLYWNKETSAGFLHYKPDMKDDFVDDLTEPIPWNSDDEIPF